jgi:hypothetical protein
MVLQGLKLRIFNILNKHGKKWAAELPSVLWKPKNNAESSHMVHSFFLVYGAEAVLPTNLEYESPRLKAYNEQSNDTIRENVLDQLEEARDVALPHSARYQQNLRRYHDKAHAQSRPPCW